MTSLCKACKKPLSLDEIAVTKKLVNRGAAEFYCVSCLAARFEVTPADVIERIDYFRKSGCTLFTHAPDLSFGGRTPE